MRTYSGKETRELKNRNFSSWLKQDVSCHEINSFKEVFNQTEPIIVRLLQYYFGVTNSNETNIYWCPRYKGLNGCNQELDITIEINDQIFLGLSIKSQFGGGYLEPNDLTLSLIQAYKEDIRKFEFRGFINDVLQDMARIRNIKDATNEFKTVTILFSKPNQKKWIDRMRSSFDDHDYIFLAGNTNKFFEELEKIEPEMLKYKAII